MTTTRPLAGDRIATFQMHGGALVFHLFAERAAAPKPKPTPMPTRGTPVTWP